MASHFERPVALAETACGSKESDLPLSRFPLRGQAGAGRVPPTPEHAARQQRALARSDAAGSPHKRAAAPLWIPCERGGAGVDRSEQPQISDEGGQPKSADTGEPFTQNT
jgi:hypothetical protein